MRSTPESGPENASLRVSRSDLVVLTKARLSFLVIVTTLVGFVLASRDGLDWMRLLHTIFGSSLAAFGAGVFNQLMEIEQDRKMKRTSDRPLPADRMPPALAFGIGWLLAALGLVHLAMKVNFEACYLTAATLIVYLFVYTPMKSRSGWNTIVGAVSGALPPLIGWMAGGGDYGSEAWFLFALLFFWQLPHFFAINWLYREDYAQAGFSMWSNGDDSGRRTATLSIGFGLALTATMIIPWISDATSVVFALLGGIISFAMVVLAWRFKQSPERTSARKLFFYTLIYLPVVLGLLVVFWK